MTPVTRKSTALLLALMLVFLPFSTSFGFSMVNADFSMPAMHTDSTVCSDMSDSSSCLQQSDLESNTDTEDECCSDHCDAYSGAQICTDITLKTDVPYTDGYTTINSPWVSDLVPAPLLRPPLTRS